MEYMIYLTNGREEHNILISSDKDAATATFNAMKDTVLREDAWLELRESPDMGTAYTVIEKGKTAIEKA